MKEMYQVWFEPTEKGASDFGWIPEPVHGAIEDRENASILCWEMSVDESAPDWREYFRYVVRTVNLDGNSCQ